MKVRKSIAAAGAVVVLGGAGALALPTVASAHDASTTLKFTAVLVHSINFTSTTGGRQETDVNSAGKTIGFDVAYFSFTGPKTGTVNAAFNFTGGLLYGTVTTANAGATFSGKVTGGTGAYAGATGTITAKTISSTKTAIKIIYR